MVGDRRQGRLVATVMAALFSVAALLTAWSEAAAAALPTGSMEGKEQRFGLAWSVLFGTATTGTSTGAVNSMHESYSPLGGGLLMLNMLLGEVSPGGVGTGLYGMLVLVVITVFVAGLMVGRTPELLGKAIRRREITYAALASIVMPALVLAGGNALLIPVARGALLADGPRRLTGALRIPPPATMVGLRRTSADQPWLNSPWACACSSPASGSSSPSPRPVPCHPAAPTTSRPGRPRTPVFAVLLTGIILLLAGLTFFRPWLSAHCGGTVMTITDHVPDKYTYPPAPQPWRPAPPGRTCRPLHSNSTAHPDPPTGDLRGVGQGPNPDTVLAVQDPARRRLVAVWLWVTILRQPRRGDRRKAARQAATLRQVADHIARRLDSSGGEVSQRPDLPRRSRRRRGRQVIPGDGDIVEGVATRRRVRDHRRIRPRHPRIRW